MNVATSSADLIQKAILLQIKDFNGVYASNEIPFPLEKGCYIINYDTNDGGGTHWACLKMKNSKNGFYSSSFGDPPLQIFYDKKINLKYNNIQIQSGASNMCGYFCIAYFLLSQNGVSNDDIFKKVFKSDNEAQRFRNNFLLGKLLKLKV